MHAPNTPPVWARAMGEPIKSEWKDEKNIFPVKASKRHFPISSARQIRPACFIDLSADAFVIISSAQRAINPCPIPERPQYPIEFAVGRTMRAANKLEMPHPATYRVLFVRLGSQSCI